MSSELQQRIESMTIGQWQARQIEKAAIFIADFVKSTAEDRRRWRPAVDESSRTRSAMEIVGECTFANHRFCAILRGEPLPTPPAEWATNEAVEEALADLQASADQLASLVRGLDAAALAKEYITHRGPMPGALVIQFPLRNMTYHIGQINMIQLLYGDTDFHPGPEFTSL